MTRLFSAALAIFTLWPSFPGALAQERVRVGWAAMTASHTPLWVAQERGFLAKQGLTAESIFFGAGPPAMQALVAGDLDIVVTSAPNVVNPRLGGADTVMILSIIPTFIDHIISAPSISTPEQLRGKTGSVNRFGSISDMGLRLSLRRLGIDPERDVRIVPAGGNPERLHDAHHQGDDHRRTDDERHENGAARPQHFAERQIEHPPRGAEVGHLALAHCFTKYLKTAWRLSSGDCTSSIAPASPDAASSVSRA